MKISAVAWLAVSLSLTACAAPAPQSRPKSLLVEMRVTATAIQVLEVSMAYAPADVTAGSQDDFFVEGLDRRQAALSRIAIANPLVVRVYNEPAPNTPPHGLAMLAEQTVLVAMPFDPALVTLRMGFTGTRNVVSHDPRSAIDKFCSRQKGDGDCSRWLAASKSR